MELHRYPPRQWRTGKKWRTARCGNLHGTPAEGSASRNGAAQAVTARGASSERYRGGVRQRRVGRHDNHGAFRRSEEDPGEEPGPAGPTGPRGGYDGRHSGAIGLHLPRGSMATPLLAGTGRDVRLARTPNEAGARSGGRARRQAPPGDMECQRSAGSAVDQDAGTLRRAGDPVAAMENILGGAEQVARSWQRRKVLPPIACHGARREPSPGESEPKPRRECVATNVRVAARRASRVTPARPPRRARVTPDASTDRKSVV